MHLHHRPTNMDASPRPPSLPSPRPQEEIAKEEPYFTIYTIANSFRANFHTPHPVSFLPFASTCQGEIAEEETSMISMNTKEAIAIFPYPKRNKRSLL